MNTIKEDLISLVRWAIYIAIILGAAELCLGQTVAVKFYGAGNSQGLPQYWPQIVQPGTNAPSGFVLLTQAQLDSIVATNQAAYTAWESNKTATAQAKLDADMADFLAKMDKIETWIDKTQGTNTLSNNQRDNAINDICQTFKKVRPILKRLYEQAQ